MGTQIDDKDISPQKFFNDFEELENSNYYCIWNMIFKIPKWPLEFSLLVFLGHVNLLYLLEIPKETLSKTESPSGEFGFSPWSHAPCISLSVSSLLRLSVTFPLYYTSLLHYTLLEK
jgi:hypothetical protein